MAQQFIGVRGSKPLDTNPVSKTFKENRQQASNPVDEQLRITYGTIAEVDSETNRVKVDLPGNRGSPIRLGAGPDGTKDGIWVPIMQPLTVIHHLYGALRKGLGVRIYWRGKNAPGGESVVEVITDSTIEEWRTGSQEPRYNELATGPHDMFTGGVLRV